MPLDSNNPKSNNFHIIQKSILISSKFSIKTMWQILQLLKAQNAIIRTLKIFLWEPSEVPLNEKNS